jgi:histidinol-phosphate aminotransferase
MDPDELVKLSSNENPLGPSPEVSAAISEAAEDVHSYPKASHTDLIAALAEEWGVADEQVWLANGGDGALDYLARAMLEPGDSVLVPDPGFAYYPMSARYCHGLVNEYSLSRETDFKATPDLVLDHYDGERIVYLTSPHNPTGATLSLDEIEAIATGTDDETLVLVDEAYGEFSDRESAIGLVEAREDVAILRTFSKAYGLAGIRLGYAIVPEEWADAYARISTPFAVSEVACRAGLAALSDREHVEESVDLVRWAREYYDEHIDAPTWPSEGNFVMVEVGDASAVAEATQKRGIIVRDCSSFGLPECIRISCGTRPDVKRAVEVLNEVIET